MAEFLHSLRRRAPCSRPRTAGHGPGQHFPDRVDSWTDFDFYSRCITRGFPNTMLYTLYDYGNQIVQAPGR
jgi:hypothetical protein